MKFLDRDNEKSSLSYAEYYEGVQRDECKKPGSQRT